jgi:hypothetical protein
MCFRPQVKEWEDIYQASSVRKRSASSLEPCRCWGTDQLMNFWRAVGCYVPLRDQRNVIVTPRHSCAYVSLQIYELVFAVSQPPFPSLQRCLSQERRQGLASRRWRCCVHRQYLYIFMCLFYLTKTTQCRMIAWLVNSELEWMWKEAAVALFKVLRRVLISLWLFLFPICSTKKNNFLGWVKEVRTTKP